MEPLATVALSRPARDRSDPAKAGERRRAAEAANVAGVSDHGSDHLRAGAGKPPEGVAVLGQQFSHLTLQLADALVQLADLAGELADAARRGLLGPTIAEADPSQPS